MTKGPSRESYRIVEDRRWSKDGSLSASWASFKDSHGALAPILLELPMAKAAIKAMDVIGTWNMRGSSERPVIEDFFICIVEEFMFIKKDTFSS